MSIVKLNIGGVRFETSTATLSRYPDMMLARLIQQPTEVESINNGRELFIDRDGTMFANILNYLRHGDQMVLPTDDPTRMISLKQEADFYGLPGLAELIKQCSAIKVGDSVFKNGDTVRFREPHQFIDYFYKMFYSTNTSSLKNLLCEICHEVAPMGPRKELENWTVKADQKSDPLGRIEEIQGDCARVGFTFGSMEKSFKFTPGAHNDEDMDPFFYEEMLDDYRDKMFEDFVVNMHIPLKYLKVDG